ncbi:PREDICTED: THUMP domain-containing protein 1 homolog [Dinoponera quadriceps]|uniref:THUMP domain-containing protein 1 homolog n=1 Tax=Dinoponera quadriceps TaxID=609295 RepID=A0A6P3WX33_DINQU|nr:PREDICTED: THUMP domain-containing protein 1 homolog [Dinoponera quadriceps]
MQTDSTSTDTRKRNNKYFTNHHKKRKLFTIEPGMTGFLCTCNFNEKGCITDAYKLLNQFADEDAMSKRVEEPKVSDASDTLDKKEDKSSSDFDKEEDISTALEKEIDELRTKSEIPLYSRRFQVVDTNVKNMIFIKSTLPKPLELVTKIVTELDATKKQCTRYLLRLLPIEVVCKAYMDDIRTKANVLLEEYFSQEPKTFSIVFNRHSNNSIKRNEIIEDLAEIISKKNPGNKADLKNPEIAVVVEVIRGLCLLSIAPNYYKFKKYNLIEICNSTKNKESEIKGDESEIKDDETEKDEIKNP